MRRDTGSDGSGQDSERTEKWLTSAMAETGERAGYVYFATPITFPGRRNAEVFQIENTLAPRAGRPLSGKLKNRLRRPVVAALRQSRRSVRNRL